MDERAAIAALQRGDIGGLEALVRDHQLAAVRAAALITRDRALAEDVVQQAFVRVYERRAQFDAARPFRPWFMTMVVRDATKALRGRARVVPLDDPGAAAPLLALLRDPAALPEEVVEAAETRAAIGAALAALPAAQREAVVLRYFLGLGEAELAARQAVPAGTIKWRLSAARTRLRALLRPQEEGTP